MFLRPRCSWNGPYKVWLHLVWKMVLPVSNGCTEWWARKPAITERGEMPLLGITTPFSASKAFMVLHSVAYTKSDGNSRVKNEKKRVWEGSQYFLTSAYAANRCKQWVVILSDSESYKNMWNRKVSGEGSGAVWWSNKHCVWRLLTP